MERTFDFAKWKPILTREKYDELYLIAEDEDTFITRLEVGDEVVLFPGEHDAVSKGCLSQNYSTRVDNPYIHLLRKAEDNTGIEVMGDPSLFKAQLVNNDRWVTGRVVDKSNAGTAVQWDVPGHGQQRNGYISRYREIWKKDDVIALVEEALGESCASGPEIKMEEMDKVVLTESARANILAVIKQHQHSKKIFEEWGLGEVLEYGKGMTMLFYGPPGTGKTWAATCIARSMGKKLHVIDTAMLQTSEPGGMERNLKAAFAEAKKKKAVLFIDECDSLVQDRRSMGQILSAETNCLLKEIEGFEGVLILATNRVDELDKALERRISLIEHFDIPGPDERERIWRGLLPSKMPLADDVDVPKMAKDYKISGGLIKNAVLAAARRAVSQDAEQVTQEHFTHGLRQVASGVRAFSGKSSVLRGSIAKGPGGKQRQRDITIADIEKVSNE